VRDSRESQAHFGPATQHGGPAGVTSSRNDSTQLGSHAADMAPKVWQITSREKGPTAEAAVDDDRPPARNGNLSRNQPSRAKLPEVR